MTRGKWQDRVKAVEQRARSYHSAPISCPYKARLSQPWQPSSVWKLFPRQSDALGFSQRCKQVQTTQEEALVQNSTILKHYLRLSLGIRDRGFNLQISLTIKFTYFHFIFRLTDTKSLFSGRARVRAGERKHRCRTEDLFSDQLHWALALLQVMLLSYS